jgi:hypothetical protein
MQFDNTHQMEFTKNGQAWVPTSAIVNVINNGKLKSLLTSSTQAAGFVPNGLGGVPIDVAMRATPGQADLPLATLQDQLDAERKKGVAEEKSNWQTPQAGKRVFTLTNNVYKPTTEQTWYAMATPHVNWCALQLSDADKHSLEESGLDPQKIPTFIKIAKPKSACTNAAQDCAVSDWCVEPAASYTATEIGCYVNKEWVASYTKWMRTLGLQTTQDAICRPVTQVPIEIQKVERRITVVTDK